MGQSDSCSNSLMIVDIPAAQGSYLVIGRLVNDIQFITGPFLGQELLRGHYLYSGSAFGPGGLRSRIFRHLNLETKKFWHFDHLKNNLRFKEIIFSTDVIGRECNFIKVIQKMKEASFPVKRFGSSDCRQKCPAHLVRLPLIIDVESVFHYLACHFSDLNRLPLG